tara:strand:+ start:1393 stop:1821 length:429 start_codon:yes stop_codon:yes gene_type:complete
VRIKDKFINVKKTNSEGLAYPDFLLDHILSEWRGVQIGLIDPDVCLKVDSSLSYCGCIAPKAELRQLVYVYHGSNDFDYETIALLVRITQNVGAESWVWENLISLELERDCGLERDAYLDALNAMTQRIEAEWAFCEELLTA